MDTTTLILVLIAILLLFYALITNKSQAIEGIKLAGNTLWKNLALLLAGFLMAGLVQVMVPKEVISNWLGNASGFKGVLIGCAAGGLIPGSPYAVFPLAGGFYQAGAGLGAMVGFISAWALWSVSRLPTEIALINPKVALIRYMITFIIPPLAGYAAQILSKLVKI